MRQLFSLVLIAALALIGCGRLAFGSPTPLPPTAAPPTTIPSEPPTAAPTQPPTAGAAAPAETPTPAPSPQSPVDTPTPLPAPEVVYVTYRDFEIVPGALTIRAGTTVVFLIENGVHQPYNFDPPNVFESPAGLGQGASWSYTFTEPGAVTIRCGYHGGMTATLVVTP